MVNSEHWKLTIKEKIDRLQLLTTKYLSAIYIHEKKPQAFSASSQEIDDLLSGLRGLFSPNTLPSEITQFSSLWNLHKADRFDGARLQQLILSQSKISSMKIEEEDIISFENIFLKYKSEEKLNELLDLLVSVIEKIILEGDDVLNAKSSKLLTKLMHTLKHHSNMSMTDLAFWLETAYRLLSNTAALFSGNPIIQSLKHAAEICCELYSMLNTAYTNSSKQLLESEGYLDIIKDIDQIRSVPQISECSQAFDAYA